MLIIKVFEDNPYCFNRLTTKRIKSQVLQKISIYHSNMNKSEEIRLIANIYRHKQKSFNELYNKLQLILF